MCAELVYEQNQTVYPELKGDSNTFSSPGVQVARMYVCVFNLGLGLPVCMRVLNLGLGLPVCVCVCV